MNDIANRIREGMRIRNMKQSELSEKTGIGKSSISTYLSGEYSPKQKNIYKIASALNVSVDWLMGYDVEIGAFMSSAPALRHPALLPIERHRLPLLGPVAAGEPIRADREYDEYVEIPFDPGRADAALRVEGDSMIPKYRNGDIVFIRYQDDVDDGDIAAVCIEDSITLKHVYHIPTGVYLVSENPKHPPMTYTLDQVDTIHLLGLAVGFLRWEK